MHADLLLSRFKLLTVLWGIAKDRSQILVHQLTCFCLIELGSLVSLLRSAHKYFPSSFWEIIQRSQMLSRSGRLSSAHKCLVVLVDYPALTNASKR
jgi:hypothetical protein